MAMKPLLALMLALGTPEHPLPVVKELVQYTLRVDSTDLSGWTIEMRFQNKSGTFRLAMAAHPEYDDRYWRYVRNVAVEPSGTITRVDSAVWQFSAPSKYMKACGPPARPPVAVRNGRHEARSPGSGGGSATR